MSETEERIPTHQPLDLDSSTSDKDSALGSQTSSSSVTDYRIENGRRYHAYHDGVYYLPNDEDEIERLDLQHHIWRLSLDGALYMSPLPENIQNVLDVGTGTGIWAIEFAQEHPTIEVTGVDLSPIQPPFVPPNCTFIVDNAEEEWVYNKKFDFIHARALVLGIHNWPKFFRQAWNFTKPGGWIELQEVQAAARCDDGSAPPDSPVMQWTKHIGEATKKVGLDTRGSEEFTKQLEAHGFINVKETTTQWPFGTWPKGKKDKEIGRFMVENALAGVSGATMALFTRHLGWSREEVEVFLVGVRKQLLDRSSHIYCTTTIHCAQKPMDTES